MMKAATSSAETSVQRLDSRLIQQYERACAAMQTKDFVYARELATHWVEQYPHVPDFRKLLREAQLHIFYPGANYHQAPTPGTGALSRLTPTFLLKPDQLLSWCERRLALDPLDLHANAVLASAAEKLGWKRTRMHTLQTLLLHPKRSPSQVIQLATLLVEDGQSDNARKVCDTFLAIFPNDRSLVELRDRISLGQSLAFTQRQEPRNS